MSWALLDDNFPNHPKVLEANLQHPLAGYLFVCGLCYCRKYKTSGFIPDAAFMTLGCPVSPSKPTAALVAYGLWDKAKGGYQIHDYVVLYDDVAEREAQDEKKRQKQDAGRKGGLARAAKQAASPQANFQAGRPSTRPSETQALDRSTSQAHRSGVVVASDGLSAVEKGEPQYGEWLAALQSDYPSQRVTSGYRTETAFYEALSRHALGPFVAWRLMRDNLENQKRGHEWRVRKMVPKLENWLMSGAWLQQHDEHPPDAIVNDTTATVLASGAAFVKGGGR